MLDVLEPDQHVKVFAVDASRRMLALNPVWYPSPYQVVNLVVAEADSTGLAGGHVDMSLALNVLPYVRDVSAVIDELIRITRPGGILAVANPVRDQFGFWERSFEGITLRFHDSTERELKRPDLALVETKTVFLAPVAGVKSISFPVARIVTLRVQS